MLTLASGNRTVLELAGLFDVSQPAITKHLNALENAGLIIRKKEGRRRSCQLVPEALSEAAAWIERCSGYWHERLDALDTYLGKKTNQEETP